MYSLVFRQISKYLVLRGDTKRPIQLEQVNEIHIIILLGPPHKHAVSLHNDA